MADDAARSAACRAILDGIGAGGTGDPVVYYDSTYKDECVYFGNREMYYGTAGSWYAESNVCNGNDACPCTF